MSVCTAVHLDPSHGRSCSSPPYPPSISSGPVRQGEAIVVPLASFFCYAVAIRLERLCCEGKGGSQIGRGLASMQTTTTDGYESSTLGANRESDGVFRDEVIRRDVTTTEVPKSATVPSSALRHTAHRWYGGSSQPEGPCQQQAKM
jgi:hypothetical protein